MFSLTLNNPFVLSSIREVYVLVDNLLRYVEDQIRNGYKPEMVKDALLRQGYSPALVDGVVESVMRKQASSETVPIGTSHEKTLLPKLMLALLFIIIIILGVVFIPDIIKGKQALLDITTTPSKFTYRQGEELGFVLEIYNMGSKERFDISLLYRILDNDDNAVLSKEETIAISTSTSHHRVIGLPESIRPGNYVLKVFAHYEDKVATSSFSFDVREKTAEIIPETKESCYDNIRNQDESGIDCGGVCGGYWYDDYCHPVPKDKEPEPEPEKEIKPGPETEEENPSTIDIIIQASSLSQTNPEQAKNLCLGLEETIDKDKCLKKIAPLSQISEFCDLITDVSAKDDCYMAFFMQQDFTVCDKITSQQVKDACEEMKEIMSIAEQLEQEEVNQTTEINQTIETNQSSNNESNTTGS